MTNLAIIIPHYNDVTRLTRCLEALAPQVGPDVEVVVADNASSEDLTATKARFAWARFVTQSEPGAGPARNAGVAATAAPWLAFMDADCVPEPDWVAQAKRIASGDSMIVTGGRVSVFDETPAPRSGAEAFETVFAFDQEAYIADKGFSVTANLVAARTTFEATGPFRVDVSEDVDWCRRATGQGYTLTYDGALSVSHPTRSDWPALAKKWRRMTAEEAGLQAQKNCFFFKVLVMPFSIFLHAPKVLGHAGLSGPEKVRALGTLARLRLARMIWMISHRAS